MRHRKFMSLGVVSLAVVMMLAMLGVGYTLWAKSLYIQGTVNTGTVNAEFVDAFTDDDNVVDNPDKDSGDIGRCPLPLVDGGPSPTSCDPADSGRDPKPRYEKDVAVCRAAIDPDDNQSAEVTLINAYPSYYCTAWFDIHNSGTIPVKVRAVMIDGMAVEPCQTNAFDLDDDGLADVEIHVTDIELCQQIEPSEVIQLDLDIHVLQEAPQGESLEFEAAVELGQYNEICVLD
jgi:hypothetical protein